MHIYSVNVRHFLARRAANSIKTYFLRSDKKFSANSFNANISLEWVQSLIEVQNLLFSLSS